MDVTWADVPGYEGRYRVSTQGQVLGPRGVILKHSVSKDGYHEIGLSMNGTSKSFKVHRIVAMTFLSTWNPELEVNHKDGNKDNNCLDNLEMVTHQENMDHYWRSGVFAEHQKHYSEYAKQAMADRWEDPEFRNKVQSIFDSLEYKQAQSESSKQSWADESKRAAAGERSKQRWADKNMHDKQQAAIKQGWSDPEKRKQASDRVSGLIWVTSPEGIFERCTPEELEQYLSKGYTLGRVNYHSKVCKRVYCQETDTIYDSMSACDRALGFSDGTTYHYLKGSTERRFKQIRAMYHLSYVDEDLTTDA